MTAKDRAISLEAGDEDSCAKFEEINDISSAEFQAAMKIYTTSFPENERRPFASIEAIILSGKARLIIGCMDNQVVLMALLYPVTGTTFMLVDYLAIAEEYRGRGLGQKFIKDLFNTIDGTEFQYLLVEIENPYMDRDEVKARRARFYRRLGLKELVGLRYLLPPLKGTTPTEMILMVLSRVDGDYLDGQWIRDIIVRIFGELYHRGVDDEILASILSGVPDQIKLA